MNSTLTLEQTRNISQSLENSLNTVLIGQGNVVREVIIALLSGGHVLLEGVPGLGKTLLARSLARCLSLSSTRIQFTADLMPADITGHSIYDPAEGQFHIRRGPIFTQLLLADEINRAPAKTQAALLEVMQEGQVSIEGESLPIQLPFMVMATQNPVDLDGTYPLPEAELDRFLFKVLLDYPERHHEQQLVREVISGRINQRLDVASLKPLANGEQLLAMQTQVNGIQLDDALLDYAVNLVGASRHFPGLLRGAGPRASIALCQAARAHALMEGRDFVIPDDIKAMTPPVLRHRLTLSADAEIEGQDPERLIKQLIRQVEVPRQ